MSPEIRPATREDAPAVRAIAREGWHAAYDEFLGAEAVDERIDDWYAVDGLEASIEDATGRPDAVFLVAERPIGDEQATSGNGENATPAIDHLGFAQAVPNPEDDSVASLARIYVRPDSWGEGVGTGLLEELEDAIRSAFDRLRLAVFAANEVGVAFYESRGFERVETRPCELDEDLEEYVYEKRL